MPVPRLNTTCQALLAEAMNLSRTLVQGKVPASSSQYQRLQVRLREIQTALQEYAHPIRNDRMERSQIPLAVRQAFVRSAMLVSRYQTVGGSEWRATQVFPTLQRYTPEPIPPQLTALKSSAQLCQHFALTEEDAQSIDQFLQQVDREVAQQQKFIQSILQSTGLDGALLHSSSRMPEAIDATIQKQTLQLFQVLFGLLLPIPATALQLVQTPTQIYFCLDYDGTELRDGELWDGLSSSDRQQITAFLTQLGQFKFESFDKFPIFGACQPTTIDPDWCDRIAQATGLSTSACIRRLCNSVSIIPTHKAEAFLVHDIWGHYWQLLFTQFESDYSILATCGEPLRAGETSYTSDGPLACRELFQVTQQTVSLDEERARLFFHGEVRQRLGLIFTHLLGEIVADIAEFKLIWDHPEFTDRLPSSSQFKTHPAKLDLSLADIDFLFTQVLSSLLEVHVSMTQPTLLEEELLSDWRESEVTVESLHLILSLKQAIARLSLIFLEEYSRYYLPTLEGTPGLFTSATFNLLYLQNAVNTIYTGEMAKAWSQLPFQSVLMLFVSSYCCSDSYAEFWDVDDALANYFTPCWLHFLDWIFSSDHNS